MTDDDKPNGKGGMPKLHFGRIMPVEHARRELAVNVPAGTHPDMLLQPGYWTHHARDVQPGDILEAFCEDGSWEASYRVMFVSPEGARLSLRWLAQHDKTEPEELETTAHAVKWISPPKKYGVVRLRDNAVVKDGLYPKAVAIEFLKSLGA